MVVDSEDDDAKDSDNDDDNYDDDYFALSISHCVTIMFCLSNSMVKPKMWLSMAKMMAMMMTTMMMMITLLCPSPTV